jgi:hypothetical protein
VRELRDTRRIGIYEPGCFSRSQRSRKIVGVHVRSKNGKWYYEPTGINTAPMIFGELHRWRYRSTF